MGKHQSSSSQSVVCGPNQDIISPFHYVTSECYVKAVGKIANVSAQIMVVATNYTSSHSSSHISEWGEGKPFLPMNTFDEVVNMRNFIVSTLEYVFNILGEEMGTTHEALLLHIQVGWLYPGSISATEL